MNEHKLRIMINTNAMWSPSGYAQQARQFVPKIAKEGYPTAIINFYGQEGGIFMLDGVYQYPKIASQWGDDAMLNHSKHFNADVMFTLQDIWTLDPGTLSEMSKRGLKWIPIVPIDHEPVPPDIFDRLRYAYRVVTYAPFGTRELKKAGMHSTYIPHTVDTSMFKKYDKSECRKQMGIPDDIYLFGMVAANKDNPPRKGFQHAMDAFARFNANHPNSGMYFHTLLRQNNGFPIEDYAKTLGIQDKIFSVKPYDHMYAIGPEDMGKVYSAMDVYLAPSLNEGFGVPIIEAQACEVPVIATNFTAMRDIVVDGETGWKLKIAEKRWTPLKAYVGIPDANHLYELMEQSLTVNREEMGKKGREFVKENFDIEVVWDKHWMPFLQKLENEIYT